MFPGLSSDALDYRDGSERSNSGELTRNSMGLAYWIWTLIGFLLPALLIAFSNSAQKFLMSSTGVLTGGFILASAIILTKVEFKVGISGAMVSPLDQPLILGALFLPPQIAAACAFIAYLPDGVSQEKPRVFLYNASSYSLGMLLASAVTQAVFSTSITFATIVPAAFVAAVIAMMVNWLAYTFGLETDFPGSARDFMSDTKSLVGFQIILAFFAVLVTAPLMEVSLFAAAAGLAAFEVATYFALRIANNEQAQTRNNEHLRDTFGRYVPAAVAERMSDASEVIEMGGAQRQITVLFCDIRGFTNWSESLAPTDVVIELNEILQELTDAVFATEGTLDKFTGDGLMAFWGAPLAQPDHAMSACLSAVLMLERLEILNEAREAQGKPPFEIGIGIHTGNAIVGNIGHPDRLDYTAVGDTVNVAARLESSTKDLGTPILVSFETFCELGGWMRDAFAGVPAIRVKGKSNEVAAYRMKFGAEDDLEEKSSGLTPEEAMALVFGFAVEKENGHTGEREQVTPEEGRVSDGPNELDAAA